MVMRLLSEEDLAESAMRIANDPNGLKNLRAKRDKTVSEAQKVIDVYSKAHAALDSVKQGIADAVAKLAAARKDQDKAINRALPEALHCPAADLDALAAEIGKWRYRIQFLTDVIEYGRRVEEPKLNLEALKANAMLLDAQGEIANLDCEIAATERAIAARDLLKAEGTIVFERVGKTWELLKATWAVFEKAQVAREAIASETSKQQALANGSHQ